MKRRKPIVPTSINWKGGEVDYCVELVDTKGNESVPASSVTSYLQLQLEDAVRDGEIEAAQAILNLLGSWRNGGF